MLDTVRQALQALADANKGILTPENVVVAARPRDSVLHGHFTWSNATAADAHRLNEARTLIRSVRVDVKIDRVIVEAPYFVRDPSLAPSQGYRSLGRLQNDEDRAREVVVSEFKRASAALSRAKAIAAVLNMSSEIEVLEQQLGVLIGRASAADETRVS